VRLGTAVLALRVVSIFRIRLNRSWTVEGKLGGTLQYSITSQWGHHKTYLTHIPVLKGIHTWLLWFLGFFTWYRRKPPNDCTTISSGTEVSTASNCSLDLPRNVPTSFKVCTLSITSLPMTSLKYCSMVWPEAPTCMIFQGKMTHFSDGLYTLQLTRAVKHMYTSMPQITEKVAKIDLEWKKSQSNKSAYKIRQILCPLHRCRQILTLTLPIHHLSWPCCYYWVCTVVRCSNRASPYRSCGQYIVH